MGDIIVRNQEVIIKLILAVIVGGFTGYEREKSNQFAGFRTHILVAIGSCITSIIALELFTKYKRTYNSGWYMDNSLYWNCHRIWSICCWNSSLVISNGNTIYT